MNDGTRRFARAKVALAATVWLKDQPAVAHATGRVTTLDPAGAFVALDADWPRGSVVQLRFELPPWSEEIACAAVVRFLRPHKGVGLEFLDMSPHDRRRIQAFVRHESDR